MKQIVILISGRGSNMQAIADACESEGWPARVSAVISNRPDAPGLDCARSRGIATASVDHRRHADRAAFDTALACEIDRHAPDLLLLAGFMRILTTGFVRRYDGRIVNVHPSLLPAFAGLATHQRAIDSGCKVTGATVHFVTPDLDHGPIIAQGAVPVRADDTAASLAERVLALEHRLYPRAVRWLVEDQLERHGNRIRHRLGAAQWLI